MTHRAVTKRLRNGVTPVSSTIDVLMMVFDERQRQEAQYGETNHKLVSGTGPDTRWLLPYTKDSAADIQLELRADYEDWEAEGTLPTWAHLVREEICEAFELPDDDPRLVDELIQVAALCVSWVERLAPRPNTVLVTSERVQP